MPFCVTVNSSIPPSKPAYNPLSLHSSLKAQCPVPALLLSSSQRRRWKTSLAAKHQSNCKVWLSLTCSPHTVHHPAALPVPRKRFESRTSTITDPTLGKPSHSWSHSQEGIRFSAKTRLGLNRVITLRVEPSQFYQHVCMLVSGLYRLGPCCRSLFAPSALENHHPLNCCTHVLPKSFCTPGSCQNVLGNIDIS